MFTKEAEKSVYDALIALSVSTNARKIFVTLLEKGPLRAKLAASLSGVRRELTYRALEELEKKSLVRKVEPENSVAYFEPVHPERLIEMVKGVNNEIVSVQNILSGNMSTIVSSYNKGMGLPHIEFKEGIEGIAYLYQDMNDCGEDTKLIRSLFDIKNPEIKDLITEQRLKRAQNKIHTKMISSFNKHPLNELILRDKKFLIDRRIVAPEMLDIPAQILIYGDKVAITSFEAPVVTTIIDNRAIRQTFDVLFSNLWNQGKSVAELLVRGVKTK